MAPGQDGVGKKAIRSKKMKTYTGWIKTDDNQFFLQVADEVGFYVCDDENSWRVPPFVNWNGFRFISTMAQHFSLGWM